MAEQKKEKLTKELQGMALATVGVFILMAFVTFNAGDVSFNSYSNEGAIHNMGGRLGAQVADLFLICFGLASYLVPLALLYMAYTLFRFKEIRLRSYKLLAFFGLMFTLAVLFAFFRDKTMFLGQQVPTGGAVGVVTARLLRGTVGVIGSMLVLLPLLAASIMILSRFSFILFAGWWLETLKHKWLAWQERRAHGRGERQREKAKQEGMPVAAASAGPTIKPAAPPPARATVFKTEKARKKEAEKSASVQESFEFIKADGDFLTPPFSLLDIPPVTEKKLDRDALTMNARLLEKKLKDYGIDGEVVEICPGPVITMYEFSPAPGIKISRIAGLADDLTMALQAMSIRIVAPIPGKGVVGIEVPNRERDMVFLREIFNCEEFHHNKMKLPLALGKDIAGIPVVTDLAQGAASAGGRLHRVGQIGLHQHHDPVPALHLYAPRRAHDHGRSQDAGILHVRGHPPPAAAGGDRSQEGLPGPEMGGQRDGAPLQADGRQGCAQHRVLQQETGRRGPGAGRAGRHPRGRDHRGVGGDRRGGGGGSSTRSPLSWTPRRSWSTATSPTSWSSWTSWPT